MTVTWVAGDESAAAVDGTGRVTAVGNGMAIVEASAEGVSGFSQVWVEQWAVQVQVSPEKVTLGEVGDTIRLLAEATDANGYVIEGAKFAWSSDRPAVTVDTDGLVTAVGNGLVWVYAAIGRRARGRAIIEVQLDRGVLLKLYEAMGGADWNRNQNWGTDAPLGTWYGVRGGGSDVSGLALRGNGLTGSIPPETADLKLLNLLALEGNSITGPIPAGIGNQPRLAVIVVSDNRLSGPIPSEFGNLGQLRILRVNDTLLSGQLPLELIGLPLEVFTRDGTDLCAPDDEEFQEWLKSIPSTSGPDC